jgi:hypothetical protein
VTPPSDTSNVALILHLWDEIGTPSVILAPERLSLCPPFAVLILWPTETVPEVSSPYPQYVVVHRQFGRKFSET